MRDRRARVAITVVLLLHYPVACQRADRAAAPTADTTGSPAESVEVIDEFWPDGKQHLRREVLRRPGDTLVDHGAYTRWYQNGRKEYEATYVRGRLHGVEITWHKNGEKRSEQHFDHGLRHGVRRDWDEQGRLRREEHYVKDRPHGTWTIWKTDGRVRWQGRFDHGQPLP